jgi:hypothetical protein
MSVCNLHLNLATRKRVQLIQPFVCEFYPGYSEKLLQGKNNPCKKLKMMEQQSGGGARIRITIPYHTSQLHRGNNGFKKSDFISTCLCSFENFEYIKTIYPRQI